jgi:hypothetical protein
LVPVDSIVIPQEILWGRVPVPEMAA